MGVEGRGESIKSQFWSTTQTSGYEEISRYQGEMMRENAEEVPEAPNNIVQNGRAAKVQRCRGAESKCVCCCFSLIHEKENIMVLV